MQPRPPSVDALARSLAGSGLPHALCVQAAREAIAAGDPDAAAARAEAIARGLLRPVVNATGVLLHTNLGRSPLSVEARAGYSNLEFDLEAGTRGSRSSHAAALLARVAHADAACVVNNGAAAVLLAVTALAAGRPVIVSRGELVEIGGGFRIPDVLAASGARLVEVGTTNRTRLSDYAAALDREPDTAVLLKVHPSNYRITGFTQSVSIAALATLGRSRGVPVVADLGSGLLDEGCPWLDGGPPAWLAGEPGVRQTLAHGAALATFSGDKLLGGPQAGLIVGEPGLVDACRTHPLARALRPGGLVLAALQTVALAYLRGDVATTLPLWEMATASCESLHARAEALGGTEGPSLMDTAGGTGRACGRIVECASVTGGGTLPGVEIPSVGIALDGDWTAELRHHDPPVIARVVEDRTVCDLRTVLPPDDAVLTKALAACAR